MKRGRLSKVEKYYIEGNTNLPITELAEALDRGEDIVQKHINSIKPPTQSTTQPKENVDEDEPKFFKLMGRKKRGEQNVATVMTPAASEHADSTRSQRVMNKKLQQAIHKPRNK